MNKTRFTSLALEVAREMRCEFPADEWDNSGEEHSEESYTFYKSELIEFATKFLAAVREEESKEAVAWMDSEQPSRVITTPCKPEENDSGWLPLFLHPQEPKEGYVLVPTEPTDAMLEAGTWMEYYQEGSTLHNADSNDVRDTWKAMIQAVKGQGKC